MLMINLSQLSHLELDSMLPGHRIKFYDLIVWDKFILWLMLMTSLPWSFFMVLSPYGKSEINSISA
jgi:hypothetical protein